MSDINFPPANPLTRSNQLQPGFGTTMQTAVAASAAVLASSNPVLLQGQIGYETDTGFTKIGDGKTAYNSLSYQAQVSSTNPKTAPLPQAGAGVGQWLLQSIAGGLAWVLPAGGAWAYFGYLVSAAAGTVSANVVAGVAAGGTTVGSAFIGYFWEGFCWRIA